MIAVEFAATIGFDALRIAMGDRPKHHDVETICQWLRHVSASRSASTPNDEVGISAEITGNREEI
jgi:2-keto-3-deoxy-L-rhamnonate aldolase RhmA